jgi:tRNA dimethylallyltransferase
VEGVVAIVGATATGKTGVAVEAAAGDAEIVNADALQVYRGLDIGTAKPDPEQRRRVRHHLIDCLDPGERFSAGEFARRARTALEGVAGRGHAALVVGGSGLYLRALLRGLAEIPAVADELRDELRHRLEREGAAALRAELERRDPQSAARLAAGDHRRLLRALEVAIGTGRPLSAWWSESAGAAPIPARIFGLTLPRAVLYDRIEQRVRDMIARGWVDEVRGLLAGGLSPDAPALQAIGYRQWVRHLHGQASFDATAAGIVTATRRYAKRQETWFRREPGIEWLDARDPTRVAAVIRAHLETGR